MMINKKLSYFLYPLADLCSIETKYECIDFGPQCMIIFVTVIKYSKEKNLRKQDFFWLMVESMLSIPIRKLKLPSFEAAGTHSEKREGICMCCWWWPFCHLQSSAQSLVLLTIKICLPTLINTTRIVPHRHEMHILGYFRLCQHDNTLNLEHFRQ